MTIQILLARSETDLPKDGSQKRKVWREGNTGVILFRNGPSAYESICREGGYLYLNVSYTVNI